MEGEWSCYGGGQFKAGRMVMLQRWPVMEGEWSCYSLASIMEGAWLCYRGGQFNRGGLFNGGGQFNGGRMVMLQRC